MRELLEAATDAGAFTAVLCRGFSALKYGRWGSPHMRWFHLVVFDGVDLLIWCDPKRRDGLALDPRRSIRVRDICAVLSGKDSLVFRGRRNSARAKEEGKCFSIQTSGGKARTLDLQATDGAERDQWVKRFEEVVRRNVQRPSAQPSRIPDGRLSREDSVQWCRRHLQREIVLVRQRFYAHQLSSSEELGDVLLKFDVLLALSAYTQAGTVNKALGCAMEVAANGTQEMADEYYVFMLSLITNNRSLVWGVAQVVTHLQSLSPGRARGFALHCMRGELIPAEAVQVAEFYAAREDVDTAVALLSKYVDRVGDRQGDRELQTRLLQLVIPLQAPHAMTAEERMWRHYDKAQVGLGLESRWPLHAAMWYQRYRLDDQLWAACQRQGVACYGLAAYLLKRNDTALWSKYLPLSLHFHFILIDQLRAHLPTGPVTDLFNALEALGGEGLLDDMERLLTEVVLGTPHFASPSMQDDLLLSAIGSSTPNVLPVYLAILRDYDGVFIGERLLRAEHFELAFFCYRQCGDNVRAALVLLDSLHDLDRAVLFAGECNQQEVYNIVAGAVQAEVLREREQQQHSLQQPGEFRQEQELPPALSAAAAVPQAPDVEAVPVPPPPPSLPPAAPVLSQDSVSVPVPPVVPLPPARGVLSDEIAARARAMADRRMQRIPAPADGNRVPAVPNPARPNASNSPLAELAARVVARRRAVQGGRDGPSDVSDEAEWR